jgi:hypothetical protein
VAALAVVGACRQTPSEDAGPAAAGVAAVAPDTLVAGVRWRAQVHRTAGGVPTAVVVSAENVSGAPVTLQFGAPPFSVVAFAGDPRPGSRPTWDELDGLSVQSVTVLQDVPAGGTWQTVHEIRAAQPDDGRMRTPLPPPDARLAVRVRLGPETADFRVSSERDVYLALGTPQ